MHDPGEYPSIGIHVLKKKEIEPKEFYVLLPGTGVNSSTNFFLNEKTSMAEFLADGVYSLKATQDVWNPLFAEKK